MTLHQRVAVSHAADSHVVRAAPPRATLSQRLWGLDWSSILPWALDDVATFELGTFADALPFMEEHYPRIFGDAPERFFFEGMSEKKLRFGDEMDVFVMRAEGKAIGVMTAHPSDWSTYYVRTFALLPSYRERGWCSHLTERLGEPLRSSGCDRWEADCSPANTAMIRMFTSSRFVQTATINSERWGQMLRFTKFLREDAEAAFRRQFLYVPKFGRNEQP